MQDNSDADGFAVVVVILDEFGDYTEYPLTVEISNTAPSAVWDYGSEVYLLQEDEPISFGEVSDPSEEDTEAGFDYYYSLDGGDYEQSDSPDYFLPEYTPGSNHTLHAYVVDKDGGSSPVYTALVRVPIEMALSNEGTGSILVNWDGATAPVTVEAGHIHDFGDAVSGVQVTLLTSAADYIIRSNTDIAGIDAASGVTGVALEVSTEDIDDLPEFVGEGDIGLIELPEGSTLSVYARGDFGGVVTLGTLESTAEELSFTNLVGSLIGLYRIGEIRASGLLGSTTTQIVEAEAGIDYLLAHGIGAAVTLASDPLAPPREARVLVGPDGLTGTLDDGTQLLTLIELDENARPITSTDPAGNVTTYSYDSNGNPSSISRSTTGTTTMTFNAEGQLIEQTKADGSRVTMSYTVKWTPKTGQPMKLL